MVPIMAGYINFPAALCSAIAQVHAAPHKLVFEFAGAGSLALWWLHSVSGSSRTILEATDRYAAASLQALLGGVPDKAVSGATARAMASQAYQRAVVLYDAMYPLPEPAAPLLGVACTATIATDYAKRGAHRCVVAVQQASGSTAYELLLTKGLRDRVGEETVVSQLVMQAIGRACGLELGLPLDLAAAEQVAEGFVPANDPLARLLTGVAQTVTLYPDGRQEVDGRVQGALLSGAFNPLHAGHVQLAAVAAEYLAVPVWFELPIINADKGTLIAEEVVRRLGQFAAQHTVVLSRAPLFVDKAALFPGCSFIVGYDTAIRLVTPHYYGSEVAMHAALARIGSLGCRFLVAGRLAQATFGTLQQVGVPAACQDLFRELPAELFRVDISSTELREQTRRQPR